MDEEKETKKLEEIKDTPENKAAVAESKGKEVVKKEKKESKPAVEKVSKKEEKKESKVEIEREYVVPLRRGFLNVPQYRRAKKAVRVLKEFMVRHMAVRDRDLNKVKIDIHLNNEIWFRGIKKPLNKVKVKAVKKDGIVYVTLAEAPEVVGYKIARELKKKSEAMAGAEKPKAAKKEKVDADKDKDGVDDKKEEKEDAKSEALKDAKVAKAAVKAEKHTVKEEHVKKTAPVRKVLK